MSDQEKPANVDETPRVTPEQAEMDLRKLLEILVPQKTVTIVDVLGVEHQLPGVVNARKQIELMRMVDEIRQMPLAEGINIDTSNASGIVGVMMALAQDPKVVDGLAGMFALAHPVVYGRVKSELEEAGMEVNDAADCFSI